MRTITTTLAALAIALGVVSSAHAAPEFYPAPSTDHVIKVEGAWHVGFRASVDDGTVWMLPAVPAMLRQQCGGGSDRARACRVEWRAFYNSLRAIRDADANPDYWPFPGPTPS